MRCPIRSWKQDFPPRWGNFESVPRPAAFLASTPIWPRESGPYRLLCLKIAFRSESSLARSSFVAESSNFRVHFVFALYNTPEVILSIGSAHGESVLSEFAIQIALLRSSPIKAPLIVHSGMTVEDGHDRQRTWRPPKRPIARLNGITPGEGTAGTPYYVIAAKAAQVVPSYSLWLS